MSGRIDWGNARVQAALLKWAHNPARAAQYLGCSRASVDRALARFGWRDERAMRRSPPLRIDWAPWDCYLGTVSDRAIARLMSRHYDAVVYPERVGDRRRALNIAARHPPFGVPQ